MPRVGEKGKQLEAYAIKFSHTNAPSDTVTIYGDVMNIGRGGFVIDSNAHIDIYSSLLTSSSGFINIKSTFPSNHAFDLRTSVTDYGSTRVGMNINAGLDAVTTVEMVGASHNTYTGDTNVSGNSRLNLVKNDNTIAVSGDLYIRGGASVIVYRSEQIYDGSLVYIGSRGNERSSFRFSGEFSENITESIHELVVDGRGVVDFGYDDTSFQHGKRWFYMDDLSILGGSYLEIVNWAEGRDFFLVRKDSVHLQDSLKRIEFEGYGRNNIHLEEFSKDYWQISAAPEPAVYGGIIGALGVGLIIRRRKRLNVPA